MKNLLFIAITSLAFFGTAKAQTNILHQSAVDTVKTLDCFARYLKAHNLITPSAGLKADSTVFTFRDTHKNPIITENGFNFRIAETVAENMPVVKLNSADRMPVAKLGDTQTTHFNMLIKRIPSNETRNPTP